MNLEKTVFEKGRRLELKGKKKKKFAVKKKRGGGKGERVEVKTFGTGIKNIWKLEDTLN